MKKTVLLILVDGLRHDYLNPADAPFLHALGTLNIEARVRETFAFELRPAFFAGAQPEECDVAHMFCYNPIDSPFRSIEVRHGDRDKITAALKSEAKKRGFSLAQHVGGCAEIPLELLKYFDFSEKYHTVDPGSLGGQVTLFDCLRDAGKKWLWIAYPDGPAFTASVLERFLAEVTGDEDFIYLHFSELDWVGHEHGPHSAQQKMVMREVDEAIRKVYCRVNQSFAGVGSIIFGDHGQVAIEKNIDIESKLSETGLVLERDYLYFLDSTQARFWFYNDAARQKVVEVLSGITDGGILSESDYERLHFRFKHNRFGDLIFVANDGVGIFPNFFQHSNPCKGLHGYLPEVEGNWGKLIVAGCGITSEISAPFEMVSLFPTLLELLGCATPESLKVESVFKREGFAIVQDRYASSVLVPTYNRLDTLKKCLCAIENQSVPKKDFEVVVVNDGSSDGTSAFLEEFQKHTKLNFRYFGQANSGPAAARNLAIKHALGHVLIVIGDDMIMEPGFIEGHLAFHQQHPQPADACLGFIDWSSQLDKSYLMDYITSEGGQQFCWPVVEMQDRENVGWGAFWSSNISFKRLFCLTHGLFNAEVFHHAMWEDVELGHRLYRAGLVLHFRKMLKVRHEHTQTYASFLKRQRMVGWYRQDLSRLEVPVGGSPEEGEANRIYSRKILEYISGIDPESGEGRENYPQETLAKLYGFTLRYAELTGYRERAGQLLETLDGPCGLLYNLSLAESELSERNRQLAQCEQQLALRERQLADTNHLLTALIGTLSWRITAPLRSLGKLVGWVGRA